MADNDLMEVAPSAESGNVPVEAPSEPATPAAPDAPATEPVAPKEEPKAEPAKPVEPVLYDLPDGRKVDAATLAKEFKENFLPDYTRKSQALAEAEKTKNTNTPQEDPYANPDYIPKNYAEVLQEAERRALTAIEAREREATERRQAVENAVSQQLADLKKIDPALDENALFVHANKYGFKDLAVAHANMRDMANLAKAVQQETAKNVAKRADPVSTSNRPSGSTLNPSQFANAVEFMRALNGGK